MSTGTGKKDRRGRVNHLGFGDRQWLGRLLRDRRLAQRRSLADVANVAGIDPGHLSRVERGLSVPGEDVVSCVAAALHLDLDELSAAEEEIIARYRLLETWLDRFAIADASRKDLMSVAPATCADLISVFESLATSATQDGRP
ncbi:MAG TPA: helix-turn-helix transcriptional regulator [Thermomicrobiales bacterium]|nr:helix-turn-helix transcriptional regulator [Thermomicrobiales bacterium]